MEAMDATALEEKLAPSSHSVSSFSRNSETDFKGYRGFRELIRRTVTSVPWSVVVLAAALVDIFLCFAAWRCPDDLTSFLVSDAQVTALILCVYTLDVAMKLCAFTPSTYLRKGGNVVDFAVTALSIAATLLERSMATSNGLAAMRAPRLARLFFRLLRMGHCCRGFRWARVACSESISGARHVVGMNKRRFVDTGHDFDLDLAYVLPRLIAMSIPAKSWLMGLYRNPLTEVVRFFETFHRGNYLIVNCCPELPYPAERFRTGRSVKFDVQDHTPPTMGQVIDFLNTACEWMHDPEHVMAVHCKGGKGRTGCLCAAWMMYAQEAKNGTDACESFAIARTDSFLPHHKQTVDTPSQVRYLEHIDTMLSVQKAYFPSKVAEPQCRRLRPLRLVLETWFLAPVRDELLVAVHEQRAGGAALVRHWSPAFLHDDEGSASVDLDVPPDFCIHGDIRVSVFRRKPLDRARARSHDGRAFAGDLPDAAASLQPPPGPGKRLIAGKEPGCLFYFMFHSSFIEGDGSLHLLLNEMDKAGKGKDKSRYRPEGLATLGYGVL